MKQMLFKAGNHKKKFIFIFTYGIDTPDSPGRVEICMLCSAEFVEEPEEGFHMIPILTQDNQPRVRLIMSLCVTACAGLWVWGSI